MIRVGDWVFFPARRRINVAGIGRVTRVHGDGVDTCKCCGLGVTLQRHGNPNVSLGFSPRDLMRLDRPPALIRRQPCCNPFP